jgi:ankyrin repeat protein
MVESLLAAGANPKASGSIRSHAGSLACSNANARILKTLLDAGADPNSPDPQGTTALMIASRAEGGTEA